MFHRPRIIPVLTIIDNDLVKTINFKNPRYIGDPINAVKIFNGKAVDELCILDIRASVDGKEPNYELLNQIASEAFVPLSYGGGITNIEQIRKIIFLGYEKVVINSEFVRHPQFIKDAVRVAGSSSIVGAIDVKKNILGKYITNSKSASINHKSSPVDLAKEYEKSGVGEILFTDIAKEGTKLGYNIDLVYSISKAVKVPLIANGGASGLIDIQKVIKEGEAHSAAASSMFVYYGKKDAVLISYPSESELEQIEFSSE